MDKTTGRTALVLGAGGMSGAGWEIGILWGLAEAGTDLTTADLIVGSSAGAVVGAQVASGKYPLDELYESQLTVPTGELPGRLGAGAIIKYTLAVLRSRTPEEYGRRLGRLAAATGTVLPAARREVVAGRIGRDLDWPDRRLLVTAVDAESGELAAFDGRGFGHGHGPGAGRDSGHGSGPFAEVPLLDAVTASCAIPGVWPVVELAGRRWIDGGIHSTANAQLAAGYERVVIIAPSAAGNKAIVSPARQGAELAAAGARVEVVTPDAESKRALGRGAIDPARRVPAARAGRAQAAAHAKAVAAVWAG
ncbi:patatin-like phospholipase family protein [Streptomyces sp. NPDC048718]|uniref:patatin-like phospholipase family protein n=1 Tax=Streptomyces sp. NPDC048718 TaxID=3365587 RepID=UPI00371EECED